MYCSEMMTKLSLFCKLYKKRILLLLLVFITVIGIFASMGYCKKARDVYTRYTEYDPNNKELAGSVGMACEWVEKILIPSDATEYLKINITDTVVSVGDLDVPIGNVFNNVNSWLVGLATSLLGTFWLVGLMSAIIHQQNYLEVFIKRLFILIIGLVLVNYSKDIVLATNEVGIAVLNKISNAFVGDEGDFMQTVKNLQNTIVADCYPEIDMDSMALTGHMANFRAALNGFLFIVKLLPSWLAKFACNVIIMFTSWSRAITIILMAVLSPLSFMDISDGRGSGFEPAMKLVKNVFAVSLQGAIIYFGITFASYALISILASITDFGQFMSKSVIMISVLFAQGGICLKSQSIAKEIIP